MPTKKKSAKTKTKKKVTTKKVAAKKTAAKKKVTKKKVAAKKTTKKVAKKKVVKKAPAKKKTTAKKKTAKKKATVAKKKVTKKATGKKSVTKKATAKKAPAKKAPAKKAPAKKPAPSKAAAAPRRSRADIVSGPIHGIAPYQPKRGEEYMSDAQLEHFRNILSAWKRELMEEVDRTVHHMQDEAANFPDPNDRATQESEFGLELRTRDRERKLLRKISSALTRIDDGSYGYCEETGEEIGLKRLEARPVATLCLEAQERRELAERQFRDRDDRYR
ncbi:MAG: RNA polymerase-binding protein DksA [Pseudomonadota bacterium]